jgi:ABC-type multidrug transport system ATPase subunit
MDKNISVAWVGLYCTTQSFLLRKDKVILNGLNGAIDFCSMNALMGPSGAGKTTLLNCLNGKMKSKLRKDSKIYLSSDVKIHSCFISQHENEHMIMDLTAKQNMIYASKLKNSDFGHKVDHEKNFKNLFSEFMTSDIMNTKVKNCSGGEQKRLFIALEMTSQIKPNLLYTDEPTTGLDSNGRNCNIFSKYNFF